MKYLQFSYTKNEVLLSGKYIAYADDHSRFRHEKTMQLIGGAEEWQHANSASE